MLWPLLELKKNQFLRLLIENSEIPHVGLKFDNLLTMMIVNISFRFEKVLIRSIWKRFSKKWYCRKSKGFWEFSEKSTQSISKFNECWFQRIYNLFGWNYYIDILNDFNWSQRGDYIRISSIWIWSDSMIAFSLLIFEWSYAV